VVVIVVVVGAGTIWYVVVVLDVTGKVLDPRIIVVVESEACCVALLESFPEILVNMGKELVKVKVRVPAWVDDCGTVGSGEKLERLRERVSRRRRRHTRKSVKKDLTKAAGINLGLGLVRCSIENA